ncbi:MAG TPA: Gldg family protein [Sporichthya sp.]|nr:Gldg family protein [Sporichthya sp.]
MTYPGVGALRVARREVRAYLTTPWSYGVAAAFLMLTGLLFFLVSDGAREASLRFWFPNLSFVLLVTVPIVTSRLIADEWRTRHLDVILSRGLTPSGLVLGKWLASVAFFALLLVPTLLYAGLLERWGHPDYPPMLAAYAGALCLVALFCAVGTLASALTPTAVAAGLASFAALVGAQLVDGIAAFDAVSYQPHLDAFSRGAPQLEDLLYFVSITAVCLVLAAAAQIGRIRFTDRARALAGPAIALAVALGVSLVPVPASARADFTATERFTLSSPTKQVLHELAAPVTVTVFESSGSAEARDDRVLLDQFRDESAQFTGRVLDFTSSIGEATRLGATDTGDVVVDNGNRREVFAPLTEEGVTSAISRLQRGKPQTACALAGHGERELDDTEAGGYELARQAMKDNGIAAMRLDLTVAQKIPSDCTMLVLPGPTGNLTTRETKLIQDYLAAAGKMMILADPLGPDLTPLTQSFGLRLLRGVVVDPERGVAGDPTTQLVNRFPTVSPVVKDVSGLQVVGGGGITTASAEREGLSVAKLAESSEKSWLEQNSRVLKLEPANGDRAGPVVLAATADASRILAKGETRVAGNGPSIERTRLMVVADADFACNALFGEADNGRFFVNALNWLAGEEDLVVVGGEEPDLRRLSLTDARRKQLGMVSMAGIPGAVAAAGVLCWYRRRKR